MTRFFSLCIIAVALFSTGCGPAPQESSVPAIGSSSATTTTTTTATSTTIAGAAAEQRAHPAAGGEELAQRSGCFACHAIDRKVVGPPWRDVAARYRGDASARERLIAKVHTGGKGNWTDVTGGVMMPPYSPRVADADIAALVDFILALPAQPN